MIRRKSIYKFNAEKLISHASRKRIEPIRFSRKISGLYFGKNPYNIHILSRIFPSSILTDLYVKTACTLQRANLR